MALIRPRLTEYHGIFVPQEQLSFAIPHLDEDIPLYLDPFLLWKSPSQQDKSLHLAIINSFNHLGTLAKRGGLNEAVDQLVLASECDEIGLGLSKTRQGKRITTQQARQILELFQAVPAYDQRGFRHFEEIQFYVDGISKDRVSDIAANFLKSFLIDFTMDEAERLGMPLHACTISNYYDPGTHGFVQHYSAHLPTIPSSGNPVLLVPKRWLRYVPWINFDEYFRSYCPRDDIVNPGTPSERVRVLQFNREHYDAVQRFVAEKESKGRECKNDPLFTQVPVISAKRKVASIRNLPTGRDKNADKRYEDACVSLLASLMYPNLDFAADQSRSESGIVIRDLIFHNNRGNPFLQEIFDDYGSKQLVMELKNVQEIEREHINQLNRYMTDELGRFGVLVTRQELSKPRLRNTIDLWSGQRRAIISITDDDLQLMVELYESKQRHPLDVVKKKYVEFRRRCPS